MAEIPEFFSLDIGNHSIKVAQLRRQGDHGNLQRVGSVKTDFGLLDNDSDEGIKKLADLIKQVRDSAGISTVNCVAAVPESPIFSRLVTIPKVTDEQLQEAVHWELKALIPVPLDEVDVAFLEIGEKEVSGQQMIDMYVVAAPKTLTTRFKKVAETAGVNLIALETESLANTRAVTFNYQTEKDIIICDFGANGTDLIIARNSIPVFAQSISTGSDALTKVIAADFGLDLEQAEKYKRAFGLKMDEGDGKIAKSIEPMMQIIISEMNRILAYFKERIGDTGATKIYMVGEAAKLPGLGEYFNSHLNLETQLVDPTAKLEVEGAAKKELEQMSSVGFSVAIGLGLKRKLTNPMADEIQLQGFRFNLLPPKPKEEVELAVEREDSITYAVLLIFVAGLIYFGLTVVGSFIIQPRLEAAKTAITDRNTQIAGYAVIQELHGELFVKTNTLKPVLDLDLNPSEIFRVAAELVGDDSSLQMQSYSRERSGTFVFQVVSPDYSQVIQLAQKASKITGVSNVYIRSASLNSIHTNVTTTIALNIDAIQSTGN